MLISPALAQEEGCSRPLVRVKVGNPADSSTDIISRSMAPPEKLESEFKDCAATVLRPDVIGTPCDAIQTMVMLKGILDLTQMMAAGAQVREAVAA